MLSTEDRMGASSAFNTPKQENQRDWLSLVALLVFALVAGIVAHRHLPFGITKDSEYGSGAIEFYNYHHITSTFLSLGYATIVGVGMVLFHGILGLAVADLTIYMAFVAIVWVLLRQLGLSAKQAFWLGAAFAIYPDIIVSVNKVYHSILTPLLLLLYVSAAIHLVRKRTGYLLDLMMAVLLGVEIYCRSNMILMFPITCFLMWKYELPHWIWRNVVYLVIAVAILVGGCTAVHGKVFWPRVGAFIFFSGWNEYTEAGLRDFYDDTGEGTLELAMQARGVPDAYHHWAVPDDLPGDHEVRNETMTRTYNHYAILYIRQHPLNSVKLMGEKVFTLLRPDMWVHPNPFSLGGIIKILVAFSLPLWLVLCCLFPQPEGNPSRLIIGLSVAVYVLPLLASCPAPRNRVAVDILCFMDSAAMLLTWWHARKPGGQTQPAQRLHSNAIA